MNPNPSNGQAGHENAARDHARSAREHATEAGAQAAAAAADIRDAATEAAQEIRDRFAAITGDFKARAKGWQNDVDNYVRENPTKSVLTALGVGFVIGALFRR